MQEIKKINQIDKIIIGTAQLGLNYGINNKNGTPTEQEAFAILDFAYNSGITTLDTAKAYGSALNTIGNYHKVRPHKFNLISKFHTFQSPLYTVSTSDMLLAGVSQFECFLYHSFDDFEHANKTTIDILKKMKSESIIKHIGVSIYSNVQFKKAIDCEYINVIQFPYNLLDNNYQRGMLINEAKKANKKIHARSVFLQGLLFKDRNTLPIQLKPLLPYLLRLDKLCADNNQNLKQLALAYALYNKHIDNVIIGVDNLVQLMINFKHIQNLSKIPENVLTCIESIHVLEQELLYPFNWK